MIKFMKIVRVNTFKNDGLIIIWRSVILRLCPLKIKQNIYAMKSNAFNSHCKLTNSITVT